MRRRSVLQAAAGTLAGVLGGIPGRASATADGPDFAPLGRVQVDGLSEVVVDSSGTVAFGALRDGFTVLDVSEPANPSELARVDGILADSPNGPLRDIFEVTLSGNRLLVAGPDAGPGSDQASGFEVYDVADPASPSRLTASATEHAIHNAFLDGGRAYLCGTGAPGEPLVIYDLAGDDPEEIARWSVEDADSAWRTVASTFRQCHDVVVRDGVAFVAYWDAGTWLLDVSDPVDPAVVANVGGVPPASLPAEAPSVFPPAKRELPGNSHFAAPSPDGRVLAVGKEARDDDATDRDGGAGGIDVWDVSDPADPARHTTIAPPGPGETSHNFGWRGRRLYTSWHGGGVHVFDLSDPSAPRLLAGWADEQATTFWTARPAAGAVVASSYLDPQRDRDERIDGVGAAFYTFPEPGDADATAAETMTPRPTPAVTTTTTREPMPSTATGGPTASSARVADGSANGTSGTPGTTGPAGPAGPTVTGATDEAGVPDGTDTSPASRPGDGFGVLAALTAGSVAAWRLLARGDGGGD
jgi:hypothetical protein